MCGHSGDGEVMRKIGMVVYPGFQVMCFVAFSAFEVANKNSGEVLYDLQVLSEKGGLLKNSFGMDVATRAVGNDEFDTMIRNRYVASQGGRSPATGSGEADAR